MTCLKGGIQKEVIQMSFITKQKETHRLENELLCSFSTPLILLTFLSPQAISFKEAAFDPRPHPLPTMPSCDFLPFPGGWQGMGPRIKGSFLETNSLRRGKRQ